MTAPRDSAQRSAAQADQYAAERWINEGGRVPATSPTVASPRALRAQITLSATLRRQTGSPIAVRILDLGPDGMRVSSPRPLADDETVDFDLPNLQIRVAGRARVLRQHAPHVYVMRFERLPDPMVRCLHTLAANQHRSQPGA